MVNARHADRIPFLLARNMTRPQHYDAYLRFGLMASRSVHLSLHDFMSGVRVNVRAPVLLVSLLRLGAQLYAQESVAKQSCWVGL